MKTIFFDYGGTLDSNGMAWKERFWSIYRKHGVSVKYERFVQAFYRSDDSLTHEGNSEPSLKEILHEQVRRVLLDLDLYSAGLNAAIAGDFYRYSCVTISANLPTLKALKETYRLGIISNNYGNLEAICRDTGLDRVMDAMVDSRVVGAIKPHRKIFLAALNALNTAPEHALMVGDSLPRDIEGALSMGMKAMWIVPQDKKQEAMERISHLCISVISDINEIPGLLNSRVAYEKTT